MLHRLVLGRRVVLGDHDHRRGQREADEARAPQPQRGELGIGRRDAAHQAVGDDVEADRRDDAGDDQAAVERVHDLAAVARLDEVAADDRGEDRPAAEHQRVGHGGLGVALEQQRAQQHRGDDGHRVGLEQVGRHAGAVADVVAHVVGDHRRVARVVLGNAGLDLAHEVGADVGTLGEDAAAQPREDRDQRAAEGEADQRLDHVVQPFLHHVGDARRRAQQEQVEAGHAQQAQADDQHAGDGAAAERDRQRLVQARARGLGRAHVRAHRDVHADVAGETGENRPDREAAGRRAADRRPDDGEQDDADDADGHVLAVEVGLRAGLDRGRDFAHPVVAGRLLHDPADGHAAVDDGGDRADEREDYTW